MLPLVYQTLTADLDVAALVGDRVYRHGEAPEGVAAPYITWFVVTALPAITLDERPRIDRYELQIDCWSDNDGTGDTGVETLAAAVRDALEGDHDMTAVIADGRDPETKRCRIGMLFTWFQPRDLTSDP